MQCGAFGGDGLAFGGAVAASGPARRIGVLALGGLVAGLGVALIRREGSQRVQNSVFECEVDPAQWAELRRRLLCEIDPARDSLRFYRLGADARRKVEHVGAKPVLDLDGPLLF